MSQRLSGDQRTPSNAGNESPAASSAVMIFFCALVAVSSSQSCLSLSWCAIHLPSGEGIASQRSTWPSVVSRSPVAHAVGGDLPDLHLSALGRKRHQRLSVGRQARVAKPRRLARGGLHEASLLGRGHEHLAARDQHYLFPVLREVRRDAVFVGLLHPALAQIVEVRHQLDRNRAVRAAGDIEQMQVRPHLVDDAPLRERRRSRVPALVPGVLLQPLSALVHGPDVHGPVAVAEEIDAPVPVHRVLAGAREIRRQRDRFLARDVLPQLLGRPALVMLRLASLEILAREEQRLAVRSEHALCGLAQRNQLDPIVAIDGGKLAVRQRRIPPRAVQHLSIRRPALDSRVAALVSAPRGQPAGSGHRVDLGRPFVIGGERDRPPVGRKRGVRLFARMGCQPPCRATLQPDFPQVALGRKHDRVFVKRGEPVIPAVVLPPCRHRQQKEPQHRIARVSKRTKRITRS